MQVNYSLKQEEAEIMSKRNHLWWHTVMALLILSASALAQGEKASGQMAGLNVAEMKFVNVPGLPTCSPGSVQSGDPTSGPSIILAKASAGCSIPWHWHTANEHLMMVSGVAHMEMKDGKPSRASFRPS